MDKEDRASKVRKEWIEAKDALSEWRDEARRAYGFTAGHQWEAQDAQKLEKEERPALTFNRTGAMVDSVCGIEINNRQEVHYYPRTMEDVRPNEIYTAGAKWARDNCNAEDEESDAFRDAVITGIGVTETLMDYRENPQGDIKIVRRDPLKFSWSAYATQKCLSDANEVYYADFMDKDEVESRWGVDIVYSGDVAESNISRQPDRTLIYDEETWTDDKQKNRVLVLHYQCRKLKPYYRAQDPFTNEEKSYDEDGFSEIKDKVKLLGMEFSESPERENQIRYVTQQRYVYYRGFYCGEMELEYGLLPVQKAGFTFRAITGKRDRVKNMWYGLVRPMMDPQKWGNKFLTLVVDIMARNAKGGAFAEENAFKDPKKAEEDWGKSGSLITLNEGAIDKVRERTAIAYPAGWDRLMNFAFDAMHWVSGMNPEVLGMQEKAQAGVLEETRKRAAIAILAPLFDALKRYRKEQGVVLLHYIREFLTDGRIIRITGKQGDAQLLQLIRQEDTAEYDVVVDDAPTSPDFREKVWQGLQPLIPALVKQGVPIPASVIQYAPGITLDVANELQRAMQGVPNPQVQQKMEQMQKLIEAMGEELQKTKEEKLQMQMDRTIELMELQRKAKQEEDKVISKLQQSALDNNIERMNAILQANVDRFTATLDAETKDRKTFIDAFTKLQVARMGAQQPQGEESKRPAQSILLDVSTPDNTDKIVGALERVEQKLVETQSVKRKRKIRTPRNETYLVEDV